MQVLDVVMRVLHIGSAIGLLGGSLFALVAVLPNLGRIDEPVRAEVADRVRRRFYRIAHPAILLLLVSGFYNFAINLDAYGDAGGMVHGLLGIKILLALAIFAIVIAQTVGAIKGRMGLWLKVNIAMGTIIVILAAIVRELRLGAIG